MRRSEVATESGFAPIDNARIYYEIAGDGPAFVMIHAGVADRRQWNNEFTRFSSRFRVLRYDMRGYGKSEPVDGEYSHLGDLTALLDHLNLEEALILMGCSMGGGLAMNLALERPSRSRALIMVDAGPTGLELDVPSPPQAAEAEKAYNAGDLDLVAELETRIWFDGAGRASTQVDPAMRRLAFEMNRLGLAHDARHLGKRVPDTQVPAVRRLNELRLPVLVVVGVHDTPYILAAADYMVERIASARKVVLDDAAHLPNLDHPEVFQKAVNDFLDSLPS
jgi:pimeloyl-ACP methyl ester carboxylesterase